MLFFISLGLHHHKLYGCFFFFGQISATKHYAHTHIYGEREFEKVDVFHKVLDKQFIERL